MESICLAPALAELLALSSEEVFFCLLGEGHPIFSVLFSDCYQYIVWKLIPAGGKPIGLCLG